MIKSTIDMRGEGGALERIYEISKINKTES